jgi:hypothetical protein
MLDVSNDPARERIRKLWWIALFFSSVMIAYSLRVIAPSVCLRPPGMDYWNFYKPVAESIFAGRGIVMPTGAFAYRYPPGYSTLLATIWYFADWIGVSRGLLADFVLTLLNAATAVLLAWFASHFLNKTWSILIGILWAANPLALALIPGLYSEVPYTTILTGAMACFWVYTCGPKIRNFGLVLSGGLMGLAMLFRPAGLFMPLVLAMFVLSYVSKPLKQRLAGAGVFLIAVLAAIMPWEIEIYRHTGEILPLSSGGLPSMIDGLSRPKSSDMKKMPPPLPADVDAFVADLRQKKQAKELNSTKDVATWLVDQTMQRPTAVIKVIGYKLMRSWYGTDTRRNETAILLTQLSLLSLSLVGGVRMWRCGGSRRELVVFVLILILTTWFMTILVESLVRYMVPVMGLLFLLVPAACDSRCVLKSLS